MSSNEVFISCMSIRYTPATSIARCMYGALLLWLLLGRFGRVELEAAWLCDAGLDDGLGLPPPPPLLRSRFHRRSSKESATASPRVVSTAATIPLAATPAALAGAQCTLRKGRGITSARNSTFRKARRLKRRSVSRPATLMIKSTGTPRWCCSTSLRRFTATAADFPAATPTLSHGGALSSSLPSSLLVTTARRSPCSVSDGCALQGVRGVTEGGPVGVALSSSSSSDESIGRGSSGWDDRNSPSNSSRGCCRCGPPRLAIVLASCNTGVQRRVQESN
mmetsp:Transcript_3886/g.7128  ORF Transcript_3886/g.7128 Transcript_3886/m.7128 type:complete len:278 (-) Transcript_3886:41-874(-)